MIIEAVDLLIKAKALISDESKWARDFYAFDKEGNHVSSFSEEATCFCSLGAIRRVRGPILSLTEKDFAAQEYAEKALIFSMGNIPDFNDDHTHAEVMVKWDEAIEYAKSKVVK